MHLQIWHSPKGNVHRWSVSDLGFVLHMGAHEHQKFLNRLFLMPNPVYPDDPSIILELCEVSDVKDPLFLLKNRPPAGSTFQIRMVLWKPLFRDLPSGLNL